MSLGEAVRQAQRVLAHAGLPSDEARRDAILLARSALGWDSAQWLTRSREAPPRGFLEQYRPLITRRGRREPVAYIIGRREFYGRDFMVTRDVLIPRPETELVVEEALRCLRERPEAAAQHLAPLIVDVGTGSGCLAITLALEIPGARVIATDISEPGLALARANARRLGADVDRRVEFVHGAFLGGTLGPIDLIVSNPPYIARADRATLPPEVAAFEPPVALFAGEDGLDVIRTLLPLATAALRPGGHVVVEIGHGQFASVRDMMGLTPGLTLDRVSHDLQGIPRVVVGRATRPFSAISGTMGTG